MSDAINAYSGADGSVVYEYEDGIKEIYSEGDRNWRNNNPGNVRNNKVNWDGKIGDAGGFCVFSDPEFGKRATRKILLNRSKEGKTLEQAIHSYAPGFENNTDAYIKDIEKRTGISRNTKLMSLSDKQMESIAEAIFIHEGTKIGKITVLKPKPKPKQRAGFYIWRTEQDEKVRGEHAARDGKVFSFNNPPQGGNPGEDYNCRCWAEIIPETNLKDIFKK